jgi:uncharacterized lipoprotein YbaY
MRTCLSAMLAAAILSGCSSQPSSPLSAVEDSEATVAMRIEKRRGGVTRDKSLPGNPVVHVMLADEFVTDADLKELGTFKQLKGLSLAHAKLPSPAQEKPCFTAAHAYNTV